MGKQVAIIGSGNWGSTIAKIIGSNTVNSEVFNSTVNMWVFEEMVNGEKLSEIINTRHENPRYLPGVTLPSNVLAIPDLVDACTDADILVFVVPHQFILRTCQSLVGKLKADVYGVSLIKRRIIENCTQILTVKGVDMSSEGLKLITDVIREVLTIDVAVLMGANLAPEVAKEFFCEATIGCQNQQRALELKSLLQTDYFRIVCTADEVGVELCGALKNVVATGAGFCDGLGYGDNTKAAVIRLGLMEMMKFMQVFYGSRGVCQETFFESCGLADLVTTCYGGRNRRLAEAFVKTGTSIADLEQSMLNGQKLQGPPTAEEICHMLDRLGGDSHKKFPLFVAVHKICSGEQPASSFIDSLRLHPEHL